MDTEGLATAGECAKRLEVMDDERDFFCVEETEVARVDVTEDEDATAEGAEDLISLVVTVDGDYLTVGIVEGFGDKFDAVAVGV